MNQKQKVKVFWEQTPMNYGAKSFEELDKIYFHSYKPAIRCGHDKVLEVGCGFGSMLKKLTEHNDFVIGLDISKTAVASCKSRGLNVIEGDTENLPFPANTFDYVYSWGVLHHTPNTQKAINEIHRVLKTGGKATIMLYHKNSIMRYYHILFKKGLVRGELLKASTEEVVRRYTDKGGPPVSKTYSTREAKKLFYKFKDIMIIIKPMGGELENFPHSGFKIGLPKFIGNRWGWFLVINVIK